MEDFSSRLKLIRTVLLKMNREEFARAVDFPEITIRSWESKKIIPHAASIEKLIFNLNQREGLKITKEGLLEGKGFLPFSNTSEILSKISEEDIFLSKNQEGLIHQITDKQRNFYLKEGDIVGGIPLVGVPENQSLCLAQYKTDEKVQIVQIFVTDKEEVLLLPLPSVQDQKPTLFDPQNVSLYRIVFFKAAVLSF